MDVSTWKAIASIESSLNPTSNNNRPTQYKGLYQIGLRGQGSEWQTHGSGDIYNAMDNATAAANLAKDNNAWFTNRFGRAPSPIETYMMHQPCVASASPWMTPMQ
jgi:SLT domain-containing protein